MGMHFHDSPGLEIHHQGIGPTWLAGVNAAYLASSEVNYQATIPDVYLRETCGCSNSVSGKNEFITGNRKSCTQPCRRGDEDWPR